MTICDENSRRTTTAKLLVAALIGLGLSGCGSGQDYELAPISGRVTLDGRPIPYTTVVFLPQASTDVPNPGPGSTAKCDDEGHYVLKTIRGEAGAVVGMHTVKISSIGPTQPATGDVDSGPPPRDAFPAKFNTASQLHFTVSADGSNEANFELSTTKE
jgi:hypothetical protein